jgi:hypothetical protein
MTANGAPRRAHQGAIRRRRRHPGATRRNRRLRSPAERPPDQAASRLIGFLGWPCPLCLSPLFLDFRKGGAEPATPQKHSRRRQNRQKSWFERQSRSLRPSSPCPTMPKPRRRNARRPGRSKSGFSKPNCGARRRYAAPPSKPSSASTSRSSAAPTRNGARASLSCTGKHRR